MWRRVFGKNVLAPFLFNMFFTAVLLVAENASSLLQPSWTAWCNSIERRRRRARKRGGTHELQSRREGGILDRRDVLDIMHDDRSRMTIEEGGRRSLIRSGECCTLTVRALYRDHQEGWK